MAQPKSRVDTLRTPAELDLAFLETSSVVVAVIVAADGRIVGANARLRELIGLVDPRAQSVLSRLEDFLVDPAVWAQWCNADSGTQYLEFEVRALDGSHKLLRGDIRAHGDGAGRLISGAFIDGDDRKALRAAAQHGARMEALGSLTAGVAHDFNNLLTVLVGNLYLIGEELRDRPPVFEKLKAARDAGKRGADLIKQLLAFARREELEVEAIDPVKVVANLLPLLRRALGARITLDTMLGEHVGAVRASVAQLESVVVNLAVNARDAIEGRGRVAIEVEAIDVQEHEASLRALPSGGSYVVVRVRDTGSGIGEQDLGRVFEPFFSTKRERGGTGLGLSMVRWFAEQAGGAVAIDSAIGRGTAVTVLLPRLAEPAVEAGDRTMPLSTLPTGHERVVVLALDDALRSTIHQTLEVLGYRVRVASGTEDLLAAVAEEATQLLVVDGLGRGDADVCIRARALAPALRVVATRDPGRSAAEGLQVAGVATLNKPFTLADLAGTVRRTLDAELEETA